jgi:hypothetical protein
MQIRFAGQLTEYYDCAEYSVANRSLTGTLTYLSGGNS